jgi:hypothetical protein
MQKILNEMQKILMETVKMQNILHLWPTHPKYFRFEVLFYVRAPTQTLKFLTAVLRD